MTEPEWVEVEPEALVEQALPAPQPAPEAEPLVLPQKAKKCVACQSGLYVTAGEFYDASVTFEYHQGAVMGQPCVKHFGWPDAQAIGPHICKTCLRCGFEWPESLPAPEDDDG